MNIFQGKIFYQHRDTNPLVFLEIALVVTELPHGEWISLADYCANIDGQYAGDLAEVLKNLYRQHYPEPARPIRVGVQLPH